jgi:hypothetical protein
MYAATRRFVLGLVALVACLAGARVAVAQTGGSVTPRIRAATPSVIAIGGTIRYALDAKSVAPKPPEGVVYAGPIWNWAATGAPGVLIFQPDPNAPAATMFATLTTAGTVTITMMPVATWTGSDGSSTTLGVGE